MYSITRITINIIDHVTSVGVISLLLLQQLLLILQTP